MIIYKITHKMSGKSYIGQTIGLLKKRWQGHCSSSRKGISAINTSILKYGKDAFTMEEIGSYKTLEDLNDAEEYYIQWFNTIAPNGYNLNDGGKNKIPSEETRMKMSLSGKGRKFSKEHCIKLSKAAKNKPKSKEHAAKISAALKGCSGNMLGKHHSKKTKKKISISNSGKNNHMYGKPGPNKGKSGTFLGKKHSEKTLKLMRQSQRKRRKDETQR